MGLSPKEIDELDVYTFSLLMHANRLKEEDGEYRRARFSWMINRSEDTNDKGKRKYKKFVQFYNYDKRIKAIDKPELPEEYRRLANFSRDFNKKEGG